MKVHSFVLFFKKNPKGAYILFLSFFIHKILPILYLLIWMLNIGKSKVNSQSKLEKACNVHVFLFFFFTFYFVLEYRLSTVLW